MKSMQDIEHRLMAEFTIETMMGNSIDVKKCQNIVRILMCR